MSWRATAYVKKLGAEKVTRAEKLLMFVLADQYLDDRKQARPQSVAELAADALMSERQARRCLRALEVKQILLTARATGRDHLNSYRFLDLENGDTLTPFEKATKGDALSPFKPAKGDMASSKGGHHGSERGTPRVGKGDIAMSAPYKEEQTKDETDETDKRTGAALLFDFWNREGGNLPKALALTPDRIAKCRARLASPDFQELFQRAVRQAARTPFLVGQNDRAWQASFDWMLANDSNVLKILEGKYGKPAESTPPAQENGNRGAAREREWKGWLVWASAKTLDDLRSNLTHDWDSYPAWARLRAQKYIHDREVAKP